MGLKHQNYAVWVSDFVEVSVFGHAVFDAEVVACLSGSTENESIVPP